MVQRTKVKFRFKLNKIALKTYDIIKTVYGDNAVSYANVCQWFKQIRNIREDVEDKPRLKWPKSTYSDENVKIVPEILQTNCCVSVRFIEDLTAFLKTMIHQMCTIDLGKRLVCGCFVQHTLTNNEKNSRIEHCKDMKRATMQISYQASFPVTRHGVSNMNHLQSIKVKHGLMKAKINQKSCARINLDLDFMHNLLRLERKNPEKIRFRKKRVNDDYQFDILNHL